MAFWSISKKRRGQDGGDNALSVIAAAVCENLRGLGLFVDCKSYGRGFREIRASSCPKLTTTPGAQASGVALLLAEKFDPPALVFEQINSRERGLGRKMVAAVMDGVRARPGVLRRVKVNDLSPFQKDGRRWWEHIADRHDDFDWRITHDPDDAHWPPTHPQAGAANVADTPDFMRKKETLAALAREFGHDLGAVTLSPEKKTFDYLGARFNSEGEATPDGRVTIFYDPGMSDARLGCCLAHELQHLRYFVVRSAHEAEPPNGPLHRRFARFAPELLARERGVSNYSNEHWDAWKGAGPPRLFSDELGEGGSEPINETIAEVAKALYNWGPHARINPVWGALRSAIDEEYGRLKN